VAHHLKTASKVANVFNSSLLHRRDPTLDSGNHCDPDHGVLPVVRAPHARPGKRVDAVRAANHLRRAELLEFQTGSAPVRTPERTVPAYIAIRPSGFLQTQQVIFTHQPQHPFVIHLSALLQQFRGNTSVAIPPILQDDTLDADKTLLEIVNHDGNDDLTEHNGDAQLEEKRELEAKLILGSYYKGWTIAEHFLARKTCATSLMNSGAVGISRPLALAAQPEPCSFCPETVQLAVEVYGGLGAHDGSVANAN
jgi:hypothetical protein